mgnify:CR=1 FL=1
MRRSSVVRLAGFAAGLAAIISPAAAQTTYPNVKVSGRLHTQAYYFDNEDSTPISNDIFVRRARIEGRHHRFAAGNDPDREPGAQCLAEQRKVRRDAVVRLRTAERNALDDGTVAGHANLDDVAPPERLTSAPTDAAPAGPIHPAGPGDRSG